MEERKSESMTASSFLPLWTSSSFSLSHTSFSYFPSSRKKGQGPSYLSLSLSLSKLSLSLISFVLSADSQLQAYAPPRARERKRASEAEPSTFFFFFSLPLSIPLSPHFALSEVGSPGAFCGQKLPLTGLERPRACSYKDKSTACAPLEPRSARSKARNCSGFLAP